MNPLVLGTAAAILAALAAIAVHLRRRQRVRQKGEVALLPARVVNPRLYAQLKSIRAWELDVEHPGQACAWAQQSDGKRFRTHVAVPLPIAGCGRSCTCQYLPVTENRRRQRRLNPLDSPELNLDHGADANRRGARGRRQEDQWSGDKRR